MGCFVRDSPPRKGFRITTATITEDGEGTGDDKSRFFLMNGSSCQISSMVATRLKATRIGIEHEGSTLSTLAGGILIRLRSSRPDISLNVLEGCRVPRLALYPTERSDTRVAVSSRKQGWARDYFGERPSTFFDGPTEVKLEEREGTRAVLWEGGRAGLQQQIEKGRGHKVSQMRLAKGHSKNPRRLAATATWCLCSNERSE